MEGSEGRWPCPQSALETAPKLTEQGRASPPPGQTETHRPPCKHHPRRKGRLVGECWGLPPPSCSTLLNKVVTPPQPLPISGRPHPKPTRKQCKESKNGDSELPAAVPEEALGRLGLTEGDGDGVGGDISHCHFTCGEHRCPGRGPVGQVCVCLLSRGLLSRLPLAGGLQGVRGR